MVPPEDTWHVSRVHKRVLKLVNFFVQNLQKPYMFDLVTHSPSICEALWSICHIGGLWAPLQNCFMVLRPCEEDWELVPCRTSIRIAYLSIVIIIIVINILDMWWPVLYLVHWWGRRCWPAQMTGSLSSPLTHGRYHSWQTPESGKWRGDFNIFSC